MARILITRANWGIPPVAKQRADTGELFRSTGEETPL